MSKLEKRRSYSGIFNGAEKFIFAGAIVILLLGALLWYNYVHRPMDFSAEKVFQQAFVETPDSVTDLTGDHKVDFGFDYWIKFKSINPVHLRDAAEYKVMVTEVGRRWFAGKWKNDQSLLDAASSYEYWQRTCHDVGKVTRQALLINKKQHCYFYRYWGT